MRVRCLPAVGLKKPGEITPQFLPLRKPESTKTWASEHVCGDSRAEIRGLLAELVIGGETKRQICRLKNLPLHRPVDKPANLQTFVR
jgi:hypothetical protein